MDTIFALSSGLPPAAIAILRISGPTAHAALETLAGKLPEPRVATMVSLRHDGDLLDRGLALRFDAPATVTGEDLVELHLHGGRAVVGGVLSALGRMSGLRAAEPGEFTRRAFMNGRLDLAEAEGLADLLTAETDSQRRAALNLAGGALSRMVADWTQRLLTLAAAVEAQLDFADEGDVEAGLSEAWHDDLDRLIAEIKEVLDRPPAERLRDGVRVVLAGPPNSGKSTLLNALVGREAAITSEIAGTTRDLIEAPVAIDGVPLILVDSAGLRESGDKIEAIGVSRAQHAIATADIVLWLGDRSTPPSHALVILVHAKSDLGQGAGPRDVAVSALTGSGLNELVDRFVGLARTLLPQEDVVAVNRRQRAALGEVRSELNDAASQRDLLLVAESLRVARGVLDRITGRSGVEDMLDSLFGRFCIGK